MFRNNFCHIRTVLLIVCSTVAQITQAQSYFYNTQQFGLQSTLLGGAVTAGSSEISMAFYNPAALRYAEDRGFDLALFMPTLSINNYGDFFNQGTNLKSTKLTLNPSLITYKTDIRDFDIVFSVLQKDFWDNELSYARIKTNNLIDKTESFDYQYRGDEKWFGMSSYFVFSDVISLGISQFWAFQNANYHYSLSSESLVLNDVQASYFNQNLELDYSSLFSMVTKVGLSVDLLRDRFGLVVTTPYYLALYQNARYERATAALEDNEYTLENIVDFDLTPTLKSGWHIDLGYSRILVDSSELWVSASFHTGVLDHEVVSVRQFGEEPLLFNREFSAIFNVAAGYSRRISRKVQFVGSVRTNFNAYDPVSPVKGSERIVVLEGDRLQVALGCKVKHKNSSFVVGLDYGVGIEERAGQFDTFPMISRFETTPGSLRHQSVTLLLTYEFIINSVSRNISRILGQ